MSSSVISRNTQMEKLRMSAMGRSKSGLRKNLKESQKKKYSENVRQMYNYQAKTINGD